MSQNSDEKLQNTTSTTIIYEEYCGILQLETNDNIPCLCGVSPKKHQQTLEIPAEASTYHSPLHSCRNDRNETGISWNANKFHRNSYIPAGIQPESTGIGMNYLI